MALRISLRRSHVDSCSHPGEVVGLMTLCVLCSVGPGWHQSRRQRSESCSGGTWACLNAIQKQ